MQQLAVELGVADHIVVTGTGPFEEVVDFVAHGDVGIIPHRGDDFMKLVLPTKAYEFAWMHRPMIASDTPEIRSMFRPESIILCDPNKPESFAEAIVDLYHHPEKRAQMAENAALDYDTFAWKAQAEHYQRLLASLSRKPRAAFP
ncbi:MAG: glycosyltransferase [Ktedonobacterales bacterium]